MADHTYDPCRDCFSHCYNSSIEEWDHTKLPCGCAARDLYIDRLKRRVYDLERRVNELTKYNVEPIIHVRWDSINTDVLRDCPDLVEYIEIGGQAYVAVHNVKLVIDQLPKEVSDLGFDYFVSENERKNKEDA